MRTIAVLFFSLAATTATAQVIESQDRFTNRASLSLTPMRLGGLMSQLYLSAVVVDNAVIGVFSRTGREWQYLQCHEVAFLADGQPLGPMPSRHNGNVGTSGIGAYRRVNVQEQILFDISHEQLLRLSKAATIEGRLCRTEFDLNADQMAAWRELASRLPLGSTR